ncbi:hypothetical protein, partial [Prevotella histicola]|uniref:hypothetical protein n=1 Tax=Prevotella histicola TaxID=470565 RepID=UPI001C5E4129
SNRRFLYYFSVYVNLFKELFLYRRQFSLRDVPAYRIVRLNIMFYPKSDAKVWTFLQTSKRF